MADNPNLTSDSALQRILPHLQHSKGDDRPVVVMTCGIAGSGKSTLSKGIVNKLPNFVRLSVDSYIYKTYGLFKIDYPEEKYSEYLDEGQEHVKRELVRLLQEKQKDIVLDLSFWNKEYREEYKEIIIAYGGRSVLVFLDADRELLERRIAGRRAARDALSLDDEGRDGDSAYNIEKDTFEKFCNGFERPIGEGEIVVKVV